MGVYDINRLYDDVKSGRVSFRNLSDEHKAMIFKKDYEKGLIKRSNLSEAGVNVAGVEDSNRYSKMGEYYKTKYQEEPTERSTVYHSVNALNNISSSMNSGMPSKSIEYETSYRQPGSLDYTGFKVDEKLGDSDYIKDIQKALGIAPDGIYDSQTKNAVMRFQKENGLVADGITGNQTLNKLLGHTIKTGMEDKRDIYPARDMSYSLGMEDKRDAYPSLDYYTHKSGKFGNKKGVILNRGIIPGKKDDDGKYYQSRPSLNERSKFRPAIADGSNLDYMNSKRWENYEEALRQAIERGDIDENGNYIGKNDKVRDILFGQTNVTWSERQKNAEIGRQLFFSASLPDFSSDDEYNQKIMDNPQWMTQNPEYAKPYSVEEWKTNPKMALTKSARDAIDIISLRAQQLPSGLEWAAKLLPIGMMAGSVIPGMGTAAGGIGGAAAGYKIGTGLYMAELEAGSAYREYLERGMDADIAKAMAMGAGLTNAYLEEILGTKVGEIPGFRSYVNNSFIKGSMNAFHELTGEVAEEGAQDIVTDLGGEFGMVLTALMRGESLEGTIADKEQTDKILATMIRGGFDTAVQSATGLAGSMLLGGGGAIATNIVTDKFMGDKISPLHVAGAPDFAGKDIDYTGFFDYRENYDKGNKDLPSWAKSIQHGENEIATVEEVLNSNPIAAINIKQLENLNLPPDLVWGMKQVKIGAPVPFALLNKYPMLGNDSKIIDDVTNIADKKESVESGQTIHGSDEKPTDLNTTTDEIIDGVIENIDDGIKIRPDADIGSVGDLGDITDDADLDDSKKPDLVTLIKDGHYIYKGLKVKYDNTLKGEARNHGTHISVGDKFFNLDRDAQIAILNHEVKHNNDLFTTPGKFDEILEGGIFGQKKVAPDGRAYWEGIFGDVGSNSVEETYTEALRTFEDNPEWLKKHHPKVYEYLINEGVKSESNIKPSQMGNETKVFTEDGSELSVRYAVVSADDLITSHDTDMVVNKDYPTELQPRQRERAASIFQVETILGSLNPELLGQNPLASHGAPIIGNDLIVESGNGRVIALKKMYKTNHKNKEKYLNWLETNKDKFGIKEIPDNPILVKVRKTDVNRSEFAKKSNASSVAAMSYSEQARSDSEKLTDGTVLKFVQNDEGNINTAGNREFIRSFVNDSVPKSETSKVVTGDGMLSQEGLQRLKNALFFKAYNDMSLIDLFSEELDNNIKNITNVMLNIAPKLIYIKSRISSGTLFDIDFSSDIAAAAKRFKALKEKGESVTEYLKQFSMFGQEDATVAEILNILEANNRSMKKLLTVFNYALDGVIKAGNPGQISLVDMESPTKADILEIAIRRFNNEQAGEAEGQSTIFDIEPQDGSVAGKKDKGRRTEGTEGEGSRKEVEDRDYYEDYKKLKTGTPSEIAGYQGRGKSREEIYNYSDVPVMGEAQYYAPNQDDAKDYGDNVAMYTIKLNNPLVISNDGDWRKLTQEAGWRYPNLEGLDREEVNKNCKDIKALILSKGYDSVVINIDYKTDDTRTMSKMFSHSQIVKYDEAAQGTKAETAVSFKSKKYKGAEGSSFQVELVNGKLIIKNFAGNKIIRKETYGKDFINGFLGKGTEVDRLQFIVSKDVNKLKTEELKTTPHVIDSNRDAIYNAIIEVLKEANLYKKTSREIHEGFMNERKDKLELTAEDKDRISMAGEKAYNAAIRQKPHKTPGGGYITKKDIETHAKKMRKDAEEIMRNRIIQEKKDTELAAGKAKAEREEREREEKNRQEKLIRMGKFYQEALEQKIAYPLPYDMRSLDYDGIRTFLEKSKYMIGDLRKALELAEKHNAFDKYEIEMFNNIIDEYADKEEKTVTVKGPVKNNLDWLNKQADLARDRLKKRHGESTTLYAGLPMDDLVDYAIIGASKIANGTVEFAAWSKEMLEEFGSNLRLFLRAVYGQSEAMLEMSPEELNEMMSLADKEDKAGPIDETDVDVADDTPYEDLDSEGSATNLRAKLNRNYDRNGIEISFDEDPGHDITHKLRLNGFKYSRRNKLWYTKYTDSKLEFAQNFVNKHNGVEGGGADANAGILEKENDSGVGGKAGHRQPDSSEGGKGEAGTPGESGKTGEDGRGRDDGTDSDIEGTKSDNEVLEEAGRGDDGQGGKELSGLVKPDGKRNSVGNNELSALNFSFLDEGVDVDFTKPNFHDNLAAIKILSLLEKENRYPTSEEKLKLSKYKGWGGLKNTFVVDRSGYSSYVYSLSKYMTNEEIASARASVRDAHYTSLRIINSIYHGLSKMGFKGGKILEPSMGTGNFFGSMPRNMSKASKLYGVEIDSITGRIAQNLYPGADIKIAGFQDVEYHDGFFDVIVGNVPFGEISFNYKGNKHKIHDYFFAKSIDKLKDGGILAFITSTGTMDKINDKLRQELMSKADLIAAYRLPNTAFKQSAGTEVTTDLIILQKREEGRPYSGEAWLNIGKIDGMPVNEYYVNHPDNLMGKLVYKKGMYAQERVQLEHDGSDIPVYLMNLMDELPKIYSDKKGFELKVGAGEIENTFNYKKYTYKEHNGNIYYVDGQILRPVKQNVERIKEYMKVKESLANLLLYKTSGRINYRGVLNVIYDSFVKNYGYLNSKDNNKIFRHDIEYNKIAGIENFDYITKKYTKSEIFFRDTNVKKRVKVADNSYDALIVAIGESGKVDIERIAELTKFDENKIVEDLTEHIIKNNDGDYELLDVYLSGNIREKLKRARELSSIDDKYKKNVELLEQAMPLELKAGEITPQLGSPWIGRDTIVDFCEQLGVNIDDRNFDIVYEPIRGSWAVYTPISKSSNRAYSKYSTSGMSFFKLLESILNMKSITIRSKDGHGNSYIDTKLTEQARLKARMLKDTFEDWVFKDIDRRDELTKVYNEKFNSHKIMDYDKVSKYLDMEDVQEIDLMTHQTKTVARILFGGDTLIAHGVGAGKTFAMIGASRELHRRGLSNKNMMVVPNNKITDFESDYKLLYPDANILVATKEDFTVKNRIRFFSKIASNNWECVIIPESSFKLLPVSPKKEAEFIETEINTIREVLTQMKLESDGKTDSRFIRDLETTLEAMEERLKQILDTPKDDSIYFDDMGIGALFVDEAHNYKNLAFYTKLTVPGAGLSKPSQRASNMFIKTRIVREDGGRVVFATATPITNSVSEMYNMTRFVSPGTLEEAGIRSFDGWAATFGQIEQKLEMSADSRNFKVKDRFSKYKNVQSMIGMFRRFADVIKTDEVIDKLPTPERITVLSDSNEYLEKFLDEITRRIEAVSGGASKEDNMLLITNDGRVGATDLRFISKLIKVPQDLLDMPSSKINKAVDNITNEYRNSNDIKGTQLVFLDFGIGHKSSGRYDFNLYDDLINKLVGMGIPKNEIVTVHQAKNDAEREQLYEDVNSGKIRVLIGTTRKMGEGVNVQKRAVALHHLNSPHKPSEIEQREGRIIRQGNVNKDVRVYTYIQEKSFDSYMWQMLARKAEMVSMAMAGNFIGNEMDEVDEFVLGAQEAMALATGNPLIVKKVEIDQKVKELEGYKAAYRRNLYEHENIVRNGTLDVGMAEIKLDRVKKDLETLEMWTKEAEEREKESKGKDKAKDKDKDKDKDIKIPFVLELNGTEFDDKEKAGAEIRKLMLAKRNDITKIGSYKGFDLFYINYINDKVGYIDFRKELILRGKSEYRFEIGESDVGIITRMDNALAKIPSLIELQESDMNDIKDRIEESQALLKEPFKYENELDKLKEEQVQLNTQLGIKEGQEEIIDIVDDKFDDDDDYDSDDGDGDDNNDVYSYSIQSMVGLDRDNYFPQGDGSSNLKDVNTVDQIVGIIEDKIGVPIMTGRFRQRAHGIFKVVPEVVRVKISNDLPTICHEVGHFLDKKFGLDNKQYRSELTQLGKPVSKPYYSEKQVRKEGVAEFVRLYLTSPEDAIDRAPTFYAHFESKVDSDGLAALNEIRTEIFKVKNLSDTDRIKNDISIGESRTSTGVDKSLSGRLSNIIRAWYDEFYGFTKAQRYVEKKGWRGKNVDTLVKLYRGLNEKVMANLTYAQTDLEGNVIGKSYKDIMSGIDKKELDDFRAYLVAKRSMDYRDRGMAMPQSFSTYYNALNEYDKKYPHFKDVYKELQTWEDNELQLLIDSGMLSDNDAANIKALNQNYVPLKRIMEAVEAVYGGGGTTLGEKNPLKRAKGSGKTIIDPLESIIVNAFTMKRAAEVNQIRGVLYDMSQDVDGFGREFVERVAPGVKGFSFNVNEIGRELGAIIESDIRVQIDALKKHKPNSPQIAVLENYLKQFDIKSMNLDKILTLFRANYTEQNGEITYYKNGKPVLLRVNSELYQALKGFNSRQTGFILNMLAGATSVLKTGALFTARYIVRNAIRDPGGALIQSEANINPVDLIKGYISSMKRDEWLQGWRLHGGDTGHILTGKRASVQNVLYDDVLGYNLLDKLMDVIEKPSKEKLTRLLLHGMGYVEGVMGLLEAGPKVAEYRKLMEKHGFSEKDAAKISREVNQDFKKYGYTSKEINRYVAFFAPNLGGNIRAVESYAKHPARTLLKGLLYVTLPTMLLYFMTDENEKYKQLAAWRKAMFYNIPLGNPKTADKFLMIPKPHVHAFVFSSLPELMLDKLRHDDYRAWEKIRESFSLSFDVPLLPTAIAPEIQVAVNKSWSNVPIESEGERRDRVPWLIKNERTSRASAKTAELFKDVPMLKKLSPKQIDYLVKGHTGSVGDFFWRLPDTVKAIKDDPKDFSKYPVIPGFVLDSAYASENTNLFYDYGEELTTRLKEARETGTYRATSHLPKEIQFALAGALQNVTKEYNTMAKALSDARKEVELINNYAKYSAAEKRVRAREVRVQMNKIAKTFNDKYERFKKENNIK